MAGRPKRLAQTAITLYEKAADLFTEVYDTMPELYHTRGPQDETDPSETWHTALNDMGGAAFSLKDLADTLCVRARIATPSPVSGRLREWLGSEVTTVEQEPAEIGGPDTPQPELLHAPARA